VSFWTDSSTAAISLCSFPLRLPSNHFLSLPWYLKLAVNLDIVILLTQIGEYTHEAHCKGLGLFLRCRSSSCLKAWECPESPARNKHEPFFVLFLMTASPCSHLGSARRTAGAHAWQGHGSAGCSPPILARGEGAKAQLRCEQLEAGIRTMRGNWVHRLCKAK